jgi:hypothetical protein
MATIPCHYPLPLAIVVVVVITNWVDGKITTIIAQYVDYV